MSFVKYGISESQRIFGLEESLGNSKSFKSSGMLPSVKILSGKPISKK